MKQFNIVLIPLLVLFFQIQINGQESNFLIDKIQDSNPRNIILIMSEDHNYKYMGFTGEIPWLKTPGLDRLANDGMYFDHAYFMTSLCTPSKATLLTGLNTHTHKVVNNSARISDSLDCFTEYLQQTGYQTSFLGSWVGLPEVQLDGFDYWERYTGKYYNPTVNVNGEITEYTDSTYSTDLMIKNTLKWLESRDQDKPFYLQINLKEAHAHFSPSKKFLNTLDDVEIQLPMSFYTSAQPVRGKKHPYGYHSYSGKLKDQIVDPILDADYYGKGRVPDWQKMQRESWHGVDYMFYGDHGDYETTIKRYGEQILSLDYGIQQLMDYLDEVGLTESTLIIYTTDNGFALGEHGLIDKRHFYEESARMPFIVHCPDFIQPGSVNKKLIQNIDIAPTILELAGIRKPEKMQGKSLVPLLKGEEVSWRDKIFYEYFWEYEFPQTPTTYGVRTDRFKYIRYHGLWDTNEFYDLEKDPYETNNLIGSPEHQEIIKELFVDIYHWLEETNGMQIPLQRHMRRYGDHRNINKY